MATIALYAGKINRMPGLIKGTKNAVSGLNTQLNTLKRKCERVNARVCSIEDVISSISASTRTQEDKIEALETFEEKLEEFAQDTCDIDEKVAELVDKNKDNFYDKYSYLKPECEKTGWEKCKDGLKKVGKWCKEHWKAVATILLVALAIAAIALVSGGILAGAIGALLLKGAIGLLIGTIVGSIVGGLNNALTRKDNEGFWEKFWEGAEDGAFDGAISGMIAGLLEGIGFLASLEMAGKMIIGAISDGVSNVLGNIGDICWGLENMSFSEFVDEFILSVILGATGEALSGLIPNINIKGININAGKGSWFDDWKLKLSDLENLRIAIDGINLLKGITAEFIDGIPDHITEGLKKIPENLAGFLKELRSAMRIPENPVSGQSHPFLGGVGV